MNGAIFFLFFLPDWREPVAQLPQVPWVQRNFYKTPKDFYKKPKDAYKNPKDFNKNPKDAYKNPKDFYKNPKEFIKILRIF